MTCKISCRSAEDCDRSCEAMATEPKMPSMYLTSDNGSYRHSTEMEVAMARENSLLAERVAELEREKEAMLKDRVALALRVEELERVLDVARGALKTLRNEYDLKYEHPYIGNAIVTIDAVRNKEGGGL